MGSTTVGIQNGKVAFRNKVVAIPATSKTTGNVTIKNAAIPGTPEYFEVSFEITAEVEDQGASAYNLLSLTIPILDSERAVYREVETRAALKIAPLLRSIADTVETMVSEGNKKSSGSPDATLLP
jgi:hypothetical protein